MDYKGQELAEQIYYYIILVCGALGWVAGYVQQNFLLTVYAVGAGVALSIVLTVPDWPIYNRHPTKWLDQLPDRPGVKKVGVAAAAAEGEGGKKDK